MLLNKNVFERLDAPFAKKGEDINNEDVVKIISDVTTRPNRFNPEKEQYVVKIQTKNGARYLTLNQDSINILIDEFHSNESKDWINKDAKVLLSKKIIGGKRVVVAYMVGRDWVLDDFGAPVKPEEDANPTASEESEIPELPNYRDRDDDIKLEDIPF